MENTENTNELDQQLSTDGVSVDWFLQNLSNLSNSPGVEFGITLNVSGQTISGTVIGGKKYFKLFAENFSSAWPHENKDTIKKVFEENAEIYELKTDEELLPPTQYIHLMDARVYHQNGSTPSNEGVLWRGKINSICGYSLGKLS